MLCIICIKLYKWHHCLGNRCYIKTNSNEIFKKYSLIVAISNKKCLAWYLYDQGAVNAERFEEFIEAIASKYRNKLFVLDNAQIHKRPRVKEILKDTGNSVVYTLPYSPRLNPIEQFFNQLKHYMKLEKAMTLPKLKESVKNSLEHINPSTTWIISLTPTTKNITKMRVQGLCQINIVQQNFINREKVAKKSAHLKSAPL